MAGGLANLVLLEIEKLGDSLRFGDECFFGLNAYNDFTHIP